jgi:two-component sensor histidine kinase
LQHAFFGRSEGLVDMRLKTSTNGLIRLEVDDDGVGLGTSNWPDEGNLGAKIARRLVSQLHGELRVDTGRNGTSITVDIPYSPATVVDDAGERRIVENPDNSAPRLPHSAPRA